MKRKILYSLLISLGLVLLLVGGIVMVRQAQAQEPEPQRALSSQAAVGTAFTYQGYLTDANGPVNGKCDFEFTLYDAGSGGSPKGTDTATGVDVSNGYFSTPVDFTGGFSGDARWLAIRVRCPATTGNWAALAGRVALNPAPYALSLRPGATVSSTATTGSVFRAVSSATSGDPAALYGEAHSSSGAGVSGWNLSTKGYGVYGAATATTDTNYGVYGKTHSPSGHGVYGTSPSTNFMYAGVTGVNTGGGAGSGVYGYSVGGRGVYGLATSGTGVYGRAGSGYGVYSEGNAHVEGDLTWKAKTSYVAVPAAAFHAYRDENEFWHSGHTLESENAAYPVYVAPVQLPHGATVTKMTFYWTDSVDPDDGYVELYRIDLMGGEVKMARANTQAAGGSYHSEDDTIQYAAIDNSQYAYYLWLNLPHSNVKAHGVVIEYTVTTPY